MNYIIITLFFITVAISSFAQNKKANKKSQEVTENINLTDEPRDHLTMRIMFYNVENLFDTINDPNKNDEDFLPEGNNRWSGYRYHKKLKNIYKVITAVGGWDAPEIIGFCEIENKLVLEELLLKTPLRQNNYEVIHHESPDNRGIDVGLIYRPDKFSVVSHEPLNVNFEENTDFKTRDILYVKGVVFNIDTLHIFVNHWPSRRGGEAESEPNRILASSIARKKIDEIFTVNSEANILLIGDFNDYPENRSLYEILKAREVPAEVNVNDELLNLMFEKHLNHEGTHKYQSHWGCLDQIIVSSSLLNKTHSLNVKNNKAFIFKNDFLLKEDTRWMGTKPNRTYEGFKYSGGFSDHLPVYVDLYYKKL